MRDFVEVISDYVDDEGNIHIDCYTTSDADEGGVSAGHISPDGEFIKGKYIKDEELEQEIVREAIKDAKERQLDTKNVLIEKVVEHIKIDFEDNYLEAVEELLRFLPTLNLKAYLPEEL